MIPWYILLPVGAIIMLFGALGAYNFKLASKKSVHPLRIYKNTRFFVGAVFYSIGALGYVMLLKYEDLLIIYPLAGLQYVWVALLGAWLLKERITRTKVCGIGLIIAGVVVITVIA